MLVGRLFGWLLLAFAAILASADAVMALGPGEHMSIATGEMLTLLSGHPEPEGLIGGVPYVHALGRILMNLPAWVVIAPTGAVLCWACRRRPRRFRFRPS